MKISTKLLKELIQHMIKNQLIEAKKNKFELMDELVQLTPLQEQAWALAEGLKNEINTERKSFATFSDEESIKRYNILQQMWKLNP